MSDEIRFDDPARDVVIFHVPDLWHSLDLSARTQYVAVDAKGRRLKMAWADAVTGEPAELDRFIVAQTGDDVVGKSSPEMIALQHFRDSMRAVEISEDTAPIPLALPYQFTSDERARFSAAWECLVNIFIYTIDAGDAVIDKLQTDKRIMRSPLALPEDE